MPHVQIPGWRTDTGQKRKIAERVTNVLIEDGKQTREYSRVVSRPSLDELRPKPACWWWTRSNLISQWSLRSGL